MFFLTGTDEHGIKMLQTAAKEGITPKELIERNVPRFKAMVAMLNCSNDEFIRTTEPRHHRASEAIWEAMGKNGDIYLDKYSGWYSVRDEAYYDESETRLDERARIGPRRYAGRMGGGGELLLPALGVPGQAARAIRQRPELRRCRASASTRSRASSKAA